jgi:putative Ca2+/H+ antiporter (TMEM165/GDT1 family)
MEAFLTSLVLVALAQKLPMKTIRFVAAGVFIATGLVTMFGIPRTAQ